MALEKRTWCYVQPPASFEMAPCTCGNADTQWSEFAKHLWCAKCEIDFIPKHAGVFDGPIPVTVSTVLGMSFDRVNLETNEVDRFNIEECRYDSDRRDAT